LKEIIFRIPAPLPPRFSAESEERAEKWTLIHPYGLNKRHNEDYVVTIKNPA
jgi:hypothetical protein